VYADPRVVRRKVEREVTSYFERQDHYRARGIWPIQYDFPQLLVAFAAPNFKPHPFVAFGLLVDMSNYDVEPPSLQFVNPFTRVPLKLGEIPTRLVRVRVQNVPPQQLPPGVVLPPQFAQALGQPQRIEHHDALLQGESPDDERPFVCLQGVREYHNNPAHTGDPWWLYRGKDAGGLLRLLDIIARHGTEPMKELQFQLQYVPSGIRAELPQEPA
jgi:hypothetical protein